jgi:hypothetical protein
MSAFLSILSLCLSFCLSVCLSEYLSVCLFACMFVCLAVCLPAYMYVCLSDCLSVLKSACQYFFLSVFSMYGGLSVSLSFCQSCDCLSVCLSVYLTSTVQPPTDGDEEGRNWKFNLFLKSGENQNVGIRQL